MLLMVAEIDTTTATSNQMKWNHAPAAAHPGQTMCRIGYLDAEPVMNREMNKINILASSAPCNPISFLPLCLRYAFME